jgi:hypothetical protein
MVENAENGEGEDATHELTVGLPDKLLVALCVTG